MCFLMTLSGCGRILETAILQYVPCKVADSKGLLASCFVYFGILLSDPFLERGFSRSGGFSV